MSIMAKGTKPVAVLRNTQSDAKPWLVCCGLCKPGLFGLDFSAPTTIQAIRWSIDWSTAQAWAQAHAVEHEARRCRTCGHLPQEAPTSPTQPAANQEAGA